MREAEDVADLGGEELGEGGGADAGLAVGVVRGGHLEGDLGLGGAEGGCLLLRERHGVVVVGEPGVHHVGARQRGDGEDARGEVHQRVGREGGAEGVSGDGDGGGGVLLEELGDCGDHLGAEQLVGLEEAAVDLAARAARVGDGAEVEVGDPVGDAGAAAEGDDDEVLLLVVADDAAAVGGGHVHAGDVGHRDAGVLAGLASPLVQVLRG
eukprot:TRINITY_DN15950_c0_g1_i1.p2 TRINITY_DN15950_c0_g1~~TRINITY_DN15950_c0_g1_i1.p2  ORF type:complete len:210 (+),score=30.57 TRINITY_DN15950_c0_g1_i1:382-1011(+)